MERDIKALKKALLLTSLYGLLMPLALQTIGYVAKPDLFRIKHAEDFVFRAVLISILTFLPNLIPLLFTYGYIFKKNYTAVSYPWYLAGSVTSIVYVVTSNTFFNIILFMQDFHNLKGKIWSMIVLFGLFPLDSILLALACYGIGFRIVKYRSTH